MQKTDESICVTYFSYSLLVYVIQGVKNVHSLFSYVLRVFLGWFLEYFILNMLGVELKTQSIDGGVCDRMEVVDENGETKVYYFEISNVFKGKENLKDK